MNYEASVKQVWSWWSVNKPRSYWPVVAVLGVLLLFADVWNSVAFIQYISSAAQNRPVDVRDTLIAFSVVLAMTASQIVIWALWTKRIESFPERKLLITFTIFTVLGAGLNVIANFFILVAGVPTLDMLNVLELAFDQSLTNVLDGTVMVFRLVLALLISFFPEYLIDFSLHRQREALAEGEH